MAAADKQKTAKVRTDVLAIVAHIYRDKQRTEAQILAFDPNDIDALDPAMLYEILVERYGVEFDEDDDNFGGFGGTIAKTIEFIAARWDGETLNEVEMPPTEEYWS